MDIARVNIAGRLTTPVKVDQSRVDLPKQSPVKEVEWDSQQLETVGYQSAYNETEHKQKDYDLSFLDPSHH